MVSVQGLGFLDLGFRISGFRSRASGFRVTPSEDDAAGDHGDAGI